MVTGLLLSSSTISQLIFLLLNQKVINPKNHKADIVIKEGPNMISYFGNNVIVNFHQMLSCQFILFSIFTITGSFMIIDQSNVIPIFYDRMVYQTKTLKLVLINYNRLMSIVKYFSMTNLSTNHLVIVLLTLTNHLIIQMILINSLITKQPNTKQSMKLCVHPTSKKCS